MSKLLDKYKNINFVPFFVGLELLFASFILYRAVNSEDVKGEWTVYMSDIIQFWKEDADLTVNRYNSGFIGFYTILYYFTNFGRVILRAQIVALLGYLLNFGVVLTIYRNCGLSFKALFPLMLSTRIRKALLAELHSDLWCVLLLNLMIFFVVVRRNVRLCVFCYSLALSFSFVPSLFFAPGLATILPKAALTQTELLYCVGSIFVSQVLFQEMVFPLNPVESFVTNLQSQVFPNVFTSVKESAALQTSSVTQKVLPKGGLLSFVGCSPSSSSPLGVCMVALGVAGLLWSAAFVVRWRRRHYCEAKTIMETSDASTKLTEVKQVSANLALTLWESNMLGVISYGLLTNQLQYYHLCWFLYGFPFLMYFTSVPTVPKQVITVALRICFDIAEPTVLTSSVILGDFAVVVGSIFLLRTDNKVAEEDRKEAEENAKKQEKVAEETTAEAIVKEPNGEKVTETDESAKKNQ